jgi:hypothetical protein
MTDTAMQPCIVVSSKLVCVVAASLHLFTFQSFAAKKPEQIFSCKHQHTLWKGHCALMRTSSSTVLLEYHTSPTPLSS